MIALFVAVLLDLKLAASVEGLRVRATLRNDGAAPVEVVVHDACAGSRFRLLVDTLPRPFATTGKRCAAPQPVTTTLAAGGEVSVLSDSLDGKQHYLVVQWQDLSSPMIVSPTLLRVDVKLAATAHARANAPVDLEVAHLNKSPEDVSLPPCGEDRLLVDGHELPLPGAPPCPSQPRTIARNGAFVTRGVIRLPAGRHVLRARWRDQQSDDVIVDVQ